MSVVAAAVVGSAVIGAAASSKASKTQAAAAAKASEDSLQAARETNELNKAIYDQGRADNEPWRIAGVNALNSLSSYRAPTLPAIAAGEFANPDFGDNASAYANARFSDNNVPDVSAWYTSALGREPDQEGLAYWESRIRDGENPDTVFDQFIASAKYNGATVNPNAVTWRQTAKSAFADARLSDKDSAFASTDIGSKPSEYRNPDFGMEGFGNTNLKDTDSAYANPRLRNLLADFSMADFEADPGYQYRLEQGGRAVENSAAARGIQLSGATLKALARFGQNEGAAEYDRAFNRFRTQKLDQYGQAVDDFGRAENQRREKYGQRMDEYGLTEAQRAAKYGIAVDQFNRADAQRQDQYSQRVAKFGMDEGQRQEKYAQRADEYGRLEGQRQDRYAQRADEFSRLEGQRQDQYGQRTDLYNRRENQRINQYGLGTDAYDRAVSEEGRTYNRLAELAGIGQRVNESNAASGRSYAQQVSANTTNATTNANNYLVGGANARAAGYIGRSNAFSDAIGQGWNMWQQDQLLKRLSSPNYGVPQQPGVTGWVSQG